MGAVRSTPAGLTTGMKLSRNRSHCTLRLLLEARPIWVTPIAMTATVGTPLIVFVKTYGIVNMLQTAK